jgi:lysozyme family protein
MAAGNKATALKLVLAFEGGLVNNPKDPGGKTNKGITQAVYDAWRKNRLLIQRDVSLIDDSEVAAIYDAQYWDRVKGDALPSGLDYAVFDYAVNSGADRAVEDLQRTINANATYYGVSASLAVDGEIGESTMAAIAMACRKDADGLIIAYCDRRLAFLKTLKAFGTFGKGWTRRVEGDFNGVQQGDVGVVDYAVTMAKSNNLFTDHEINANLPTAIGDKPGEVAAKALPSHVAIMKTVQGWAAALTGSGVTGQVIVNAAQQVQPHIDQTVVGKMALIVFVVLMVAGGAMFVIKFFEDQHEKAAG